MTTQTAEYRIVAATDGAALAYDVVGQGEPVVFLHGGVTNRVAWTRQREALASDFRLILRDLRGHDGAPSAAPPDYRFDTTEMDDLLTVLDAEGIDRAHLVGHSTGGAIAFLFALRHPERVRRQVLIEPTLVTLLPAEVQAMQKAAYEPALAAAERDGPATFTEMALTDILGSGWETRVSPRMRARLEAQAVIAMAHARAFEAMVAGESEMEALGAPTLLLYGDQSMEWGPLISVRIGAVRPDLEPRVIAGAGHNVHIDQAEVANAAIREFLGGATSRA
jgi:pimeloyl-ACP methyl ester carboxylesterase